MSPTQTTVAMSGVKPMVSASLKFSVVPVLAAEVWSDMCSGLLWPKISARLLSSLRMEAMMKATPGSMAWRLLASGLAWYSACPCTSVTESSASAG